MNQIEKCDSFEKSNQMVYCFLVSTIKASLKETLI